MKYSNQIFSLIFLITEKCKCCVSPTKFKTSKSKFFLSAEKIYCFLPNFKIWLFSYSISNLVSKVLTIRSSGKNLKTILVKVAYKSNFSTSICFLTSKIITELVLQHELLKKTPQLVLREHPFCFPRN